MQNRKITKMVENYSLDEVIGSGQYGKVYRATNIKTNKVVAIKVVKIQKFKENPKLEECTVNEIKTLSQMDDNRHVVQFIELLRSSNNYYFVYEFCSGGTLEDQLKKKKIFKENEALHVFAQLVEAFKVLRKFNIMHRDLKPTNILLHNNSIKLADFGFCKSLTNPTDMAQTMLGSPLYMAPEILRGQDYCVKADIWSLGVVLYELLFGICPFEEKSIVRLISLLNDGQLVIRKDIQNISPQTEALLMAMLVKDPEQRISWDQLFQIQINSDGEYVDPNSQIKGGVQNLSSKKERIQQPKPPHSTPQQFQNASTSQEEIQKQNQASQSSSNTPQTNNVFQQHQQINSQIKPQSSVQPTNFNSNHQRSVSSHAMFAQHSKVETPSKTPFTNGGGMTRDYSNDKLGLAANVQTTEKKSNDNKEKINSVQQFQQVLDTNSNNVVGFNNEINRPNSQNSNNSFVPHPPQRENPFRNAAVEDKISQQNFKIQEQIDSPLAPQRLQLDQAAQSIKDASNNNKFQRQDHKRALTSIGGVANYQKPLSINNNIMNIQQNEHRENNPDYLNVNTAATAASSATSSQTNLSGNLYSNSDSKRNILNGQTLEERYKQHGLQTQKPPTLLVTPTQTLQAQPTPSSAIQKDPQISQDQTLNQQQSSAASGRSIVSTNYNQNSTNIAQSANSASAPNNSQALNQINPNNGGNPSNPSNLLQNSGSSSKINSNNQLNASGNNQISMYISTGNQIPPIHPSIASAGVCKNNKPQNADVSQRIVQELSKERNKLFFLTQLLYELIDICENENYNIILPQITYQYYQQIILTRCERIRKLIELNQSFISQQIDLPAPLTTVDLARTMMNEGYIKIRSAIEKEITLIEQNFLHVKNEYLYFEIYFQQNNNNEQFQSMKNQNIEQLIKSFIKQVIANNDSDEGGENSYIDRLRICAKLVDVYDFDNILIQEQGNNINNWAYNKEIKNADKQKILSKIFNHQSLSPIN